MSHNSERPAAGLAYRLISQGVHIGVKPLNFR